MKDNCTDSHIVSFLSFSQDCLFIIELIDGFGSILLCERSEFSFLTLTGLTLSLYLRKWLFFALRLLFEFVSLNFDECFLFHGEVVFFVEFLIFFLILILESMESFNVLVQFFLLFLNSLVVCLVEISLF